MAIGGHLITLLALIGAGLGYPTGAPETACIDMTPGHNNVVAMDTGSPYMFRVNDLTVEPGDVITVAITGRVRFRGFLLQARWVSDDLNSATVGMFVPSDRQSKAVACNGQENSALTHTNKRRKTTVQAVWRAPRNAQGRVRFIATVVMSFEEYWTGITSSIVTILEPMRPNVTTGVYQSAVLTTTSSEVTTAAELTTESSPTTTGKTDQETESTGTEVDGGQTTSLAVSNVTDSSVSNTAPLGRETALSNTETSTPFERLETTQTQPAQANQSTTQLRVTLDTMLGTANTPSTDADSEVSATSTQSVDVNETNFSESTTHNGVDASDKTQVLTDFSTTSQSDFHTTKSLMENTTTIPDFETSKSTLETPSQYDNTVSATVLTENTSLMGTPTFEPSTEMKSPVTLFDNSSPVDSTSTSVDPPTTLSEVTTTQLLPHISTTTFTSAEPSGDSSTTTYSASTSQPNTSTTLSDATTTQLLPHTSTTTFTSAEPLDGSSTTTYGSSASQSKTSTTLSDAATERQPNTSTTPFASTESLFDMSTTSTSQPETSTTLSTVIPTPSSNTSPVSTSHSPLITTPVEMFTKLRNVSSTTQANIPISLDDDFVTNATESAVMTSLFETHFVENSTEKMTTQNTTEMTDTHLFETPTQHPFVPPTTTEGFEGTESSTDLALISTSVAPSSGSTSVSALVSSGSTSIASKTTSRSTSESMTTASIPTSESSTMSESSTISESSTMSESTTSGSTTEFTTESISTTQTTNSTEAFTTSTMSTNTEQQQLNPEVSTTYYVVTESANEIRMRVRIENIPFTEDLNDPTSESFGSIARQVEQAVFDLLYRRTNVTMVDSVKVLKITQGSIVPEVQILASEDLDDSTKSAWLGVMYNELKESNGRMGNFTVSEMSAVTTDGTFVEVDPCFLLPCPVSMVCHVYQTNCFSNCNLNGNYCLNDGVCQEPPGENQLVSCRCDSRHEGDRCEVRKDPVSPPQNGDDKSNLIIAAVWGSIGGACFVLIIILSTWLTKNRRKKQRLRRTAALVGNTETGSQNRAQMDSYARRLASIRAGVLIDIGNISMSGSEGESLETGRQLSRTTPLSDAESTDHLPRFVEGGVHVGGLPDILQCASITDYEMDFMNPPLRQKRKSVSFSDVAEMVDFVATDNFTLGNPDGSDGNFQVRWDFQIDRSDSRESSS